MTQKNPSSYQGSTITSVSNSFYYSLFFTSNDLHGVCWGTHIVQEKGEKSWTKTNIFKHEEFLFSRFTKFKFSVNIFITTKKHLSQGLCTLATPSISVA